MENVIIESTYDNLNIAMSKYIVDNAKANILIIHGMIEHRMRYDDFAKYLNKHNYNVYTYDKRGHGESINDYIPHGYFSDLEGKDALLSDILDVIKYIKTENAKPLYLFAHSMGTIEIRCFLQLNSHLVSKVVLSGAPNYQKGTKLGILLAKLLSLGDGAKKSSKLIYNLSLGKFANEIKDSETNLDWLSYNKENVKKDQKDPYCSFNFTNNGYLTLFTLVNQMHKPSLYLSTKENPILFIYGKEDPCTGYEKGINNSVNTLKEAGFNNISVSPFENMRHEIINEDAKEKVYEEVLKFYER